MKKQIQILIGVIGVATLLLVSCQNESTPAETVKKWIYSVENEDVETLMELTVMPEGQPAFSKEQWEQLIIPKIVTDMTEKDGIKEIIIEEEEYDSEKVAPGHAFVQYTIAYKDGTKDQNETISLVKKDAIWKVMME